VTRVMGFLPANFQLPVLFLLNLGSGTGQTDGQTDRRRDKQLPSMRYLFIEYATSAGHHKKTCIHTEMRKKTLNTLEKSIHT